MREKHVFGNYQGIILGALTGNNFLVTGRLFLSEEGKTRTFDGWEESGDTFRVPQR